MKDLMGKKQSDSARAKISGEKNAISFPRKRTDRERRTRQSERLSRVLSVLNLIQSRGRWNTKSIAAELSCSERTVFRDLEVLQFAGVPWFYDDVDACYRIRSGYHVPILGLTHDEAVGQALAGSLGRVPGIDVTKNLAAVDRKVRASQPKLQQQIMADAGELMQVIDLKLANHSHSQQILETLQSALFGLHRVVGRYQSPYEATSRKIELHPYRLCLMKNAWYVIGRIQGEDQPKTLRVARFSSLRELQTNADVPLKFDISEYLGDAWSVYRGETKYVVRLQFYPPASRIVTETHWHHSQVEERTDDESVILKFVIDGLDEVANWILGWSGSVKILEPGELHTLVVAKWRAALDLNLKSVKTR